MKLKTIVGTVLVSTLIIYAIFTLFGTLEPTKLGFSIFIIIFSILLFTFSKKDSNNRVLKIINILIICIAFSFLLSSLKIYNIGTTREDVPLNTIIDETNHLSDTNDYYSDLILFYNGELLSLKQSNDILENKIDEGKLILATVTTTVPTTTQTIENIIENLKVMDEIIIYDNDYFEDQHDEHEDRQEEDDDD